ncbi:shikimate kinase [Paucisalibacillus sp. EB02]|uniref:shikimate kinase n=1 Tax=Paucisalibacillus sp. EB02 TaxID=1347087 RepID=UPI0004B2C9E1|nr:shikimate kinase [Paucisalibacillus sp. EB02]
MKHIYLIGFMGSGKSTVAKRLGEKLNMGYLDIDKAVEKSRNKKITSIFKDEGEKAFRSYETTSLKTNGNTPIISTGGGIVEKEENIKWMKDTGIIIYLQTSFKVIKKRLQKDISRPLWREDEENKDLYKRRTAIYERCADYIIDCDTSSLEEIIDEIIKIYRYKGKTEGEK